MTQGVTMFLEVFAPNSTAASSGRSIFQDGWVIVAVAKGMTFPKSPFPSAGYLHFGLTTCAWDQNPFNEQKHCSSVIGSVSRPGQFLKFDGITLGNASFTRFIGRNNDSSGYQEYYVLAHTLIPGLE